MLVSLHIENVAVIKSVDIDFSQGFTVLTGETGAGKSIIIDSVNLLLGAKADKELIRRGADGLMVSGGAPVLSTALTDSIVKIEAAENVIVVKTLAGMANAIAVCIDSLEIEKLVGSVAGDDTVLLVIKTVKDAIEVEKNLKEAFSF